MPANNSPQFHIVWTNNLPALDMSSVHWIQASA